MLNKNYLAVNNIIKIYIFSILEIKTKILIVKCTSYVFITKIKIESVI